MRKIGIAAFFAIFLAFFAPFFSVYAEYTPPYEPAAEVVYMVNLDTDTVVYQKNANKKMYPASLTKIMTTILAMENTEDLDGTMVTCGGTVWDEFEGIDISNAGIIPGEKRSMRDLLYCMMVQSADEGASIVADYVGGTRADFVAMMNEKAQALGAVSTHFVNPHGLDDAEHYTTAQDMYLIAKYAMQIPGFMDIASAKTYALAPSNKRSKEYLNTTNKMMVESSGPDVYYQYVKGIKTGTTDAAGRCCISTATKDGYTYLLVVMNAPSSTDAAGNPLNMAFVDSKKLYEWAFDTFEVKELANAEKPVTEVPVKLNWDKDFLYLRAESSFSALVPKTVNEGDVIQRVNIPAFINAPVKKGDVIGTVELMVMGEKVGSVNLLADEDLERSDVLYFYEVLRAATKTTWFYVGAGIFALLLLIMIIGSITSGRNKRSKNRPYY